MIISLLIITTLMPTRLLYRMADNSHQLRLLFNERVRGLGLTAAQARLLLSLQRNPGKNQAFYAERLEIEPITLTRIADRMEESGWIERRADPSDRRARILHLTAKSRGIVTQLQAIIDGISEDTLRGLTPMERETLSGLLERIETNLDNAREPEILHG